MGISDFFSFWYLFLYLGPRPLIRNPGSGTVTELITDKLGTYFNKKYLLGIQQISGDYIHAINITGVL